MSGKTQAPRGKGGAAGKAVKPGRGREPRGLAKLFSRLEDPSLRGAQINYYVVLGSTLALTLLGLIMVLSSSSVEAIARNKSPFDDFSKQAMWAVLGLLCMATLQLLPTDKLKKLAWPALGIATVLLMMVLVFGEEIYGNKNWLIIGGFSVQPSEFAKAAMALWGAAVVERKAHLMGQWKHAVVPLLAPFGGLMLLLVLIGKDLGTAMVLALILVVVMFVGGAPAKIFGIGGGVGGRRPGHCSGRGPHPSGPRHRLALRLRPMPRTIATRPSRGSTHWPPAAGWAWAWANPGKSGRTSPRPRTTSSSPCSARKWACSARSSWCCCTPCSPWRCSASPCARETIFGRVAVSGIMAWIVGQAFVNIGMVIGLLPVIGVPLPFISSGGSALLATFLGIGVVLVLRPRTTHGQAGPGDTGHAPGLMARLRGAKAN